MPTDPTLPRPPLPAHVPAHAQEAGTSPPSRPQVVIRCRTLDSLYSPLLPQASRGSPIGAHSPWEASPPIRPEEPGGPQADPNQTRFIVLHDPGAYPLETGASLSLQEIYYGLKIGSFYKGTLFYDQKDGTQHRVIRQGARLALEPASWRLHRYAQNRES